MKDLHRNLKLPLLFFVVWVNCITANAQKLPKIQQTGVWALGNVRVDGKVTEWQNKFEAFNSKEQLYYTIANDDKNLYLVIHTRARNTINKIYVGGISFAISAVGKQKTKKPIANEVSVTYPVVGRINNGVYLHASANYKKLSRDSLVHRKSMVDFIAWQNKQFEAAYKELKVHGIPGIEDPLISLFNTDGIKARALFDNRLEYTYELAIPLKYLDNVLKGSNMFKYTIKLNGNDRDGVDPYEQRTINSGNPKVNMNMLYIQNPTDFSGECSLAVKQ